ncbi:hypothetical protein QOZ80_2AG0128750 [Eleusine coracana subsp. coracana]|nr:hypothetical protein QOZ80_2AG0128750 [Eleusine coracana subsp. coracana]
MIESDGGTVTERHLLLVQGIAHIRDIFFVVVLHDSIPEPALAETRFLLLDRAGNEMPAHTQKISMRRYRYAGDGYGFLAKKEIVEAPDQCLADDCFKIRLDIRVFTGSRRENRGTIMASAAVPAAPLDLQRHLGDLLVAGEGADVTFLVAGETFRAHRCVLAARSPVFKAELYGAMRQSDAAAAELCIRIHDMEPDQVFSALLQFVYTDSLPSEIMTGQEQDNEVVMAQHVLEAADRFDMPRLKLSCEEKLCRCLDIRTTATTLVLADQHHCHSLKKACIQFLRSPQVLQAVMATEGFQLIIRSYPTLFKEFISKVTAP